MSYPGQYSDGSYGEQGGYYNQQQQGYSQDGFYQPQAQQQAGQDEWFGAGSNQNYNYEYQGGNASQQPAPPQSNVNVFNPSTSFTSTGFDQPSMSSSGSTGGYSGEGLNFDDEPPLLEELGINFDHIWTKTSSVLIPTRAIKEDILHDADLAGPLVFCLVQGFCLLFSGKLFFGYVFGFGVVGCICMYLVVNLMNHANEAAIDMYRVFSVLGYCLLPIVMLSAVTILFDLRKHSWLGTPLTLIAILWCTQTATRFFEAATQMREQRYLIAYPVFLFYAVFALITVF